MIEFELISSQKSDICDVHSSARLIVVCGSARRGTSVAPATRGSSAACRSYSAVRGAGAAEAGAASPIPLVIVFEGIWSQLAGLPRWQFFFDLRLSFTQIILEL